MGLITTLSPDFRTRESRASIEEKQNLRNRMNPILVYEYKWN